MKTCFQRGCIFVEYRNNTIHLRDREFTITRRIETQHNAELTNVQLFPSERARHTIIHQHGG